MSYPANIAFFSTGNLVYADSTGWDPANFPVLPSTLVTLSAQGVPGTGISTLTLTNSTIYESFEPAGVRSILKKQFQVGSNGLITLRDTTLGYVSTIAPAFQAAVSSFVPSTIGGAGLLDALSGAPDTVTNGLAKLDAWIANAFLYQPPAVVPVQAYPNSMYGSLQWTNFVTYSILDKSVPYVTSIVIIIGDPTTNDYCTLEISDETYFPYKNYTDGISPLKTPLVALRIFTDFFPLNTPISYTKAQLQANCVRLISESGDATFPGSGKVVGITPTDGETTYTTMSVYLPDLSIAYPNDSPVPVSVIYLNNTTAQTNIVQFSTIQTTTGGPSAPTSIQVLSADPQAVQLQVERPVYSDSIAQLTTPFFSTYVTEYTVKEMATANTTGQGFQYGLSNPLSFPSTLQFYIGSTFQQAFTYYASTQILSLTGTLARPLLPGVSFSTSTYAINEAFLVGAVQSALGPIINTDFPTISTLNISSVAIQVGDSTQARNPSSLFTITHGGQGWTRQAAVPDAVFFLSTIAPFQFALSTSTQFNDATYPGDLETIQLTGQLGDPASNVTTPVQLTLNPTGVDYVLNVQNSATTNSNVMNATLRETQTSNDSKKFFYSADVSGAVNVSTISTNPFTLQVILSNHFIADSNTLSAPRLLSTPVFRFRTEPANAVSTARIHVTDVTSTIQISGIYTPTPGSRIVYDMSGTNFAHLYATSSFAKGFLEYNASPTSPIQQYSTNVRFLNNGVQVTTLPIPQNTLLLLSSLTVPVGDNIYVDPNDPRDYTLIAGVTPASPIPYPAALRSTLLSSLYADTYSYYTYTNFMSTMGSNGQRILSLLPNVNDPGSANNINDGVNAQGEFGVGLNTDISSFVSTILPTTVSLQSSLLYQHSSSLTTAYPNFYSRELLFTSNTYFHPAGFNFAQFNGGSNVYPNFTYDLDSDVNFGYRYATFAFEWEPQNPPELYGYINIQVNAPSLISSIGNDRTENNWWPDSTVSPNLTSSMKVRMHAKLVGTYDLASYETFETAWLNCMKQLDFYNFDDAVFDTGAAIDVTPSGSNIIYKAQVSRRLYTKVMAFVRIGIAQDGSQYSGFPITFQGLNASLTNS